MKTGIVYWVCTTLLCLALFAMGLSNFVQPGDMNVEIAKSGYPSHFFMVLGVWQVLAAIAISVPFATVFDIFLSLHFLFAF